MALGLNYLHMQRPPMLHRDLTSSNILLDAHLSAKVCWQRCRAAPVALTACRCKIADFGLSRPHSADISEAGGNLLYMAPEAFLRQVRAHAHRPCVRARTGSAVCPQAQSKACDVYSYGIVLWEILTGGVPFGGISPALAASRAATEQLRPVLPGALPAALQELLRACWAEDPGLRPDMTFVVKVRPLAAAPAQLAVAVAARARARSN